MALQKQEFLLYRNLKTMLKEPLVHDTFVQYAQMQYDIALKNLLHAKELVEIGKWQGLVSMWEHFIHLRANVDKVLSNAN